MNKLGPGRMNLDRSWAAHVPLQWLPLYAYLLPTTLGSFASLFAEDFLAEADLGRGDLNQLVILDVFQRQLKGQFARRLQQDIFVGAGGPHVRELLFLAG